MNKILVFVLIINIIIDILKIKSNTEVVKTNNKVYEAQQGLKIQINEKNKILKESKEEIIKMKENHKELKDNLSINYDHLAKEIIKRINENNKNQEIILNIGGEKIGKVSVENLKEYED